MKKIYLLASIASLLTFVTGCSLLPFGDDEKPKIHTISIAAKIEHNHPDYKTIIVPMKISKVRTQIFNVAKAEGFEKVVMYRNTIHAEGLKVAYNANTDQLTMLTAGAAGGMVGAILPVMGGVAALSMPLVALSAIGAMLSSKTEDSFIKSSNAIAKLKTVSGGTEVKLNFVRIIYKENDRDEYYVSRVEAVDERNIYESAFKKLQAVPNNYLNNTKK
jgi:hypothetical protein